MNEPRSNFAIATQGLSWIVPLLLSQVCIHASMAGARLAVPLTTLQLGGSALSVGVLLSLFSGVAALLALPAGRFVDRHSLRLPVELSAVMACAGAACVAIVPNVITLGLAAIGTGFATTLGLVAIQRCAGRRAHTPDARKAVFSWLAIGPAISNFIGPVMAGFLLDHGGLRICFVVLAIMPLASLLFVRLTPNESASSASPGEKTTAWQLLADPSVRRLLFVNWLLSMSWDVHTFVVPVFGHAQALSASVIGMVMGAFALSVTGVRVLIPFVASRMDERQVLVVCMVFTAGVFAAYPFAKGAWQMGALSLLLGLALGCVQPMILSALHILTPDHRHGEALGLRMQVMSASGALMPMLFGSLGAAAGVATVFWLAGGGVAAGSWLARSLPLDGVSKSKD
jgi:MFS family permease